MLGAVIGLALPIAAVNAAGCERAGTAPQGFSNVMNEQVTTVAQINQNARDDQIVYLDGKFTNQVRKDKYTFVDNEGNSIVAELDKKCDWSHVVKDQPVRIKAEVDKDRRGTELDVISVMPLTK